MIQEQFREVFKIKDLREIKKILDIRITRDREKGTLRMNQTPYFKEVLKRLHMIEDTHKSKEHQISMNDDSALKSAELDDKRFDSYEYARSVESFMYVVIHTRSNIAFSLRRLNQYLVDLIEFY